jgi:predicted nucleic acid-binding protein
MQSMNGHDQWCGSALARTETLMALHQVAIDSGQHDELWRSFRDDWDTVVEIPVDDRCLARATEIGARYRLRTSDAIHLAAADRLPSPISFLTLDRRQIPAAADLGFEVVSSAAAL